MTWHRPPAYEVAIFIADDFYCSSLAQVIDLFELANCFISERLAEPGTTPSPDHTRVFHCRLVSADGNSVRAFGGQEYMSNRGPDSNCPPRAIYVPDFRLLPGTLHRWLADLRSITTWIEACSKKGTLICGCGCGLFLLAEAGLLEGLQISISPRLSQEFHRRYPHLIIDAIRDISESDNVLCAAGLEGNSMMILRLIEKCAGSEPLMNFITETTLIGLKSKSFLATDPNPHDIHDEVVAKANHWLSQHFTENITLPRLAEALAVSESTLKRHFMKATGRTPHAHLEWLRIDAAQRLLLSTNLHIDKIGQLVGYTDGAYFKRVFRRVMGTSPSGFKRDRTSEIEAGRQLAYR